MTESLSAFHLEGSLMSHRWLSLPILLLSICSGLTFAQGDRTPTPYSRLYNEWKGEVKALDEAAVGLSAQDKAARKKELNARYQPRFLALAKEHAEDGVWVDCLIWASAHGIPGPDYDALFDVMRDHAGSLHQTHQLQLLMSYFIRMNSERINPALKVIAEKHPQHGLRGAALYVLAVRAMRSAEHDGDVAACAAVEKELERVLKEYPDVGTYAGKNADLIPEHLADLRSPVALGRTVPSTPGKTITGVEVDVATVIRGKVAVISFSGHWCPPCVAMHPVQKELLEKYPQDVVLVEINNDGTESLDKVRAKLAADGLGWMVVTDGSDGPLIEQWRIHSWPTYVFVDATGTIRRRVVGNMGRRMISWVEELLGKQPE
jgi:thiol-disulfide isomerase/thioredoxin